MGGFVDFNQDQTRIPNRGPNGLALAAAIGAEQDREQALLREAVLCRYPARCPDDALDTLGGWYRIERYAGEAHDTYRARLVAAWETWEAAGSPYSVEAQIRALGIEQVQCYEQPDFHGGKGAGPHCFWVRVGPTLNYDADLFTERLLGWWTLGEGVLGSRTCTRALIVAIKRIILRWKAAHGYAVELIAVRGWTGALLGMGQNANFGAQQLTGPLTLGAFQLGAGNTTTMRIPIGRPLGSPQTTLGTWALGGYEL